MTTMETLRTQGFHFFGFAKPEQREAFKQRCIAANGPEFAAMVEVNEVYAVGKLRHFEVFYLAFQKLNHVPVKFTPAGGE
jgi:hypothetical protein